MGNAGKGFVMAYITLEENDQFITVETGPLTRVTISDLTHHVSSTGFAKLNHPDIYDEGFGIQLATSRAVERLQRKVQRKLIQSLG
jgi:hypothetical protein